MIRTAFLVCLFWNSVSAGTVYPVGQGPRAVYAADFNHDSVPDFAVANQFSDDVSIFLGKPSAQFVSSPTVPVGSNPASLAGGDLNADGNIDLLTANYGGSTLSALYGQGDGTFLPTLEISTGYRPSSLAVALLPGSKSPRPVIAVGHMGSDFLPRGTLTLFDRNEAGNLREVSTKLLDGEPRSIQGISQGDRVLFAVSTGSCSSEGRLTLLSWDGSTLEVLENRPSGGILPRSLAIGDIDQDGLPDLAVVHERSNQLALFLTRSQGKWGDPLTVATAPNPVAVQISTTKGNSLPTVIVSTLGNRFVGGDEGATLTFFTGSREEGFQPRVIAFSGAPVAFGITLGENPRIVVADMASDTVQFVD